MSIDRFHQRKIVRFTHRNRSRLTYGFEDQIDKHRECCLCFRCDRFKPDGLAILNCPIAQTVFLTCVRYDLVTPVFECPEFKEKTS